jgi:hypothetical protein
MLIYAKVPEVYYGRDSTVDEQAAHVGELILLSLQVTKLTGCGPDHCIDHLRQTIMCHGSTDIIPFRRDWKDRNLPRFNGPHVCRKYEPLRAWAEEHKAWNFTPEGEEEEHEN